MLGAGDMGALKDFRLTLTVNGEVRQSDSTRNLVYGPAETLTELSGVHDLHPATSSRPARRLAPAGCALAIPSPTMQRLGGLLPDRVKWDFFTRAPAKRTQYLKAGDVVEARIKSADGAIDLGVQRNRVVEG